MDKLPFTLDRGSSITLTEQIVDGFRRAILLGVYRPGETLPTFREIVRKSDACMIIVREAFRRLAAEGLVCPRRGVGSIVRLPENKPWRGHIVIASIEVRENHLISAMTGALRQALMKAGYMVSFVPFGGTPGNYDFTHLDSVLRGPVTLVVTTSSSPKIDAYFAAAGVPFISFGKSKKAAGAVELDCSAAIADFVGHCLASGVRRVTEVSVGATNASAASALRRAGIACESWKIIRKGGIEDIARATLSAFYDRMANEGKSWLPDVLYFNDNFASQNALLALVESGVDIPDDVRLVTWSNAGEGPFWRKTLARIEIDPFEAGRIFARHVLSFLMKKKILPGAAVSPVYIPGDTFPAPPPGRKTRRTHAGRTKER